MIEIKEIITDNKDLEYIKECAESVGMDVTEKTAFSIPFIAEVMRKMKEQSIVLRDGATNGDMIKAMFPDAEIEYHKTFVRVIIKTIGDNYVPFNYDVWNSPYRKEQE